MKTVLILNGPPGCGKDTLQAAMSQRYGIERQSMKAPMFDIAKAILGPVDFKRFMADYDNRSEKENPQDYLQGESPRTFMIWISEHVIKPKFGNQHFGKLASDALKTERNTAIFSDGGFPDEVRRLVDDGYKVKLVRLHREGFDFGGDSRDYIHIPELLGGWQYREYDVDVIPGDVYAGANELFRIWKD